MRLFLLLAISVALAACSDQSKPDISDIRIDLAIQRFDKDFFSMDTNRLETEVERVYKKYPVFLPAYFEYFSPINFIANTQGKTMPAAVKEYFANIKPLYDSVQIKFSNLNPVQEDLKTGLAYIKSYYPGFKTPAVLTSVESLNPTNKEEIYGTLFFNDTLVISLQMFLGRNFSAYDPTQYFDYLRRRFEPEYIVPNSIRAVTQSVYPDTSGDASLIEQFIEKGKQWYLMNRFMPDAHDSVITLFSRRQLEWCEENEGEIWAVILNQNPDLYTLDPGKIQSLIGEAPFTQNLEASNSSPGNIGQWVGWRIVEKYAEKNSSLTINQVVQTPARKIFQEAKYKPK